MTHLMGENHRRPVNLQFDHRLRLEFHGAIRRVSAAIPRVDEGKSRQTIMRFFIVLIASVVGAGSVPLYFLMWIAIALSEDDQPERVLNYGLLIPLVFVTWAVTLTTAIIAIVLSGRRSAASVTMMVGAVAIGVLVTVIIANTYFPLSAAQQADFPVLLAFFFFASPALVLGITGTLIHLAEVDVRAGPRLPSGRFESR